MKKVLITGANSYIGTSFERFIKENHSDEYQIDTLDMRNPKWKMYSFKGYDSILHVAGIAHADTGKVTEKQKQLYYEVNCDLAVETATKALEDGVKQFVYMSSIIIFGASAPYGKQKVITKDTEPNPENFYGDSKLKAENRLFSLQNEDFNIVILRPPMIYGSGCKGNYKLLEKLVDKSPIFPKVNNQRSVLHIDNLCEFIGSLIKINDKGIFHPQDEKYVSTSDLVKQISEDKSKKILFLPGFKWLIYLISRLPGRIGNIINKAFGNLVYRDYG